MYHLLQSDAHLASPCPAWMWNGIYALLQWSKVNQITHIVMSQHQNNFSQLHQGKILETAWCSQGYDSKDWNGGWSGPSKLLASLTASSFSGTYCLSCLSSVLNIAGFASTGSQHWKAQRSKFLQPSGSADSADQNTVQSWRLINIYTASTVIMYLRFAPNASFETVLIGDFCDLRII